MKYNDPFGFAKAIEMKALDNATLGNKRKVMKALGIEGKRLIGHTAKEDYYEDTKGNTYSYDGKKVIKLKNGMYGVIKRIKEIK